MERRKWLVNRIRELSIADENGVAFAIDMEEMMGRVKEEHKCIILHEEISWRQKSRVHWLKEGDKNTAYFHAMASARRRRNRISSLNINGNVVDDKEGITSAILQFYGSLYSSENVVRPIPEEVNFNRLSMMERNLLERPFDEEEVQKCVFSMSRVKRLALMVSVLAKILADRLKVVMPLVICLVKKESYANWIWKKLMTEWSGGVWTICWGVWGLATGGGGGLEDALNLHGFQFWLNEDVHLPIHKAATILGDNQSALKHATNPVCHARTKHIEIEHHFIREKVLDGTIGVAEVRSKENIADIFTKLMAIGSSKELFRGFMVGRDRVEVSHLQFADDTLLFCSPSDLGLRYAKLVGCKLEVLPSLYLGLPLGVGRPKKHLWDPIVDRIERRLETWKMNLISRGGRLVLVKAVLANIPIYFLSLFKYPISVVLRIEKIQRRFLWGGSSESKGIPLVKWERVCLPFKNGGLGIRRIREFNHALLGKWLWRFGVEQDQFCVKVMSSKYGHKLGKWESDDLYNLKWVTVWRDILKIYHEFSKGIRFKVYSGDRIRFWYDAWCSPGPLMNVYPELFVVAASKEAMVSDCFVRSDGGVSWMPTSGGISLIESWRRYHTLLSCLNPVTSNCLGLIKEFGFGTLPASFPSDLSIRISYRMERNARVFEGSNRSPYRLYINTIALTISWAKCLSPFRFVSAFNLWEGWRVVCFSGESRSQVVQEWEAPPIGWMKLNFDGSSLGNPGPAGIGGLYCDFRGIPFGLIWGR
ncbi:uncharacterized protein LOC143892103 [Tasmannia lanceolata]|uniref:uncharacterized protein LOC143892103 n=1 Tax=Tasmannia lanceolata TaxID=3420 RepID=UPI004062BF24